MPEIEFIIHFTTPMDQMMGITGSIREFGEWNPENITPMNFVRSADGNWRLKMTLQENLLWEYKYVVLHEKTKQVIKQETRSNREAAVADRDEIFRDGFNVERIEEERERLQKTRELQFEVELKRIGEQRERDQKLLEERLKRKEEKKEALRRKKLEELRKRKEEEKRKLKEQKKKELEEKSHEVDSSARELSERLRRERLDTTSTDSDSDRGSHSEHSEHSEDDLRVPEEKDLLDEMRKAEQEEILRKMEEERKKQSEEREKKLKERIDREEERKKQMEEENRKLEDEMEKRKEERRKRREERLKKQEEEEARKKQEEEEKKKQEEDLLAQKFNAMMTNQAKVTGTRNKTLQTKAAGFNPLEEQARARQARKKKEEEEKKKKEEEDEKKRQEEEEKKRQEEEERKKKEEEDKRLKEEEEKKRKEEEERKRREEEERKRKEEEDKKRKEEEDKKKNEPVDEEEERRRRREERRKGRDAPAPVVVEEEEDEERKKKRLEREARSAARAQRSNQRKKDTDAEIEQLQQKTAALLAAQEEERKKKEEEQRKEEEKLQAKLQREREAERLKVLYTTGRRDEATPLPEILPLEHEVLFSSGKPNPEILKFYLLNQGRLEKQSILLILSQVQELLKEEPNLLELKAPLIIFGDIHGQFYDMVKMMNLSGDAADTQYLFLGDYVDRGYFATEVILYLYCLKLKFPKNIWLLRGNHECRGITAHYNFKAECLHKYDSDVYDAFCDSFDRLPLAAVIQSKTLGKWLAVHGGIGPQVKTLDDIKAIDRCVEIPEEGPLCDLLWSDPLEEASSNGLAGKALERWLTTEFRPNHTRGTSCFYGLQGVKKFLETNDLNCIIRAHEVQKHGFMEHRFLQAEREIPYVITVFSAPNYCDKYENFASYVSFTDDEYESHMMTWTEHPYQLPHFIDVFSFIFPFTAESVTKFFIQLLDFLRKGSKGTGTKQEEEEMEKKAQGMAKLMVFLKQNRMQNQSEVMPLADKYKQNLSMFDRAIREDGNNELRPLSAGFDARKLSRIKSSPHVAGMAYGTKRAAVPQRQATFHFGKKKAANVGWV